MDNMKLIAINDYDICNYKLPSMFLIFPKCTFKCDRECGQPICQNSSLASETAIEVNVYKIVQRYLDNPLTRAVVCGGLEPFDTWLDLYAFIEAFREFSNDTIVIYTGYYENEIEDKIKILFTISNIIIKFGRFIPDSPHIFDPLLGVELASNNQYAKIISGDDILEYSIANYGENTNA